MVQRMACVVLHLYLKQKKVAGRDVVAKVLALDEKNGLKLLMDAEKLGDTLSDMDDRGSRYLGLEKALGTGAALVLGTSLSESQ